MSMDVVQQPFLANDTPISSLMAFDLGDTVPELQLFRGKRLWLKSQETLACFKQATELDDAGSTESLRCLLEPLLMLFGQKKLKTETLVQEVEERVTKAEEEPPRQRLQQELKAVCHNRTLEVTQLSEATTARGRMALVKMFETTKVDPAKGRTTERSPSLRSSGAAAGSAERLSFS